MRLRPRPLTPARHKQGALAAAGALTLALALGACGEASQGAACLGDDVERCACPGGRSGFMVCAADGRGYGACNCALDGSPLLPEAGVASDAAPDGAPADAGLSFLSTCALSAGSPACPAGTYCYAFPAKGEFCSKACHLPTDCPAPSPGCNMMGTCQAP